MYRSTDHLHTCNTKEIFGRFGIRNSMINDGVKQKISDILNKAIDNKIFPGAVVGIVDRGGAGEIVARGHQTYDSGALPMEESSVFDVASITKVLPTSTLALQALQRGDISLDARVSDWLPELSNSFRDKVLVRHLMTHTIVHDFRLSSKKDLSPSELLQTILTAELGAEPGKHFYYSNSTSVLLGLMIGRVYGKSLDTLARANIFEPLGLEHTGFDPREFAEESSIVPTEIDPWRGRIIRGEVHDESAWILRKIMYPGSAGLFSTVPDLLIFLQDLLKSASHNGGKLLGQQAIELLSTDQIKDLGACTGLGWELNQFRYMGQYHSERTVGKTGFTGCVIILDLYKGIGVAFLSNFTWPRRKSDPTLINDIRREIADIVFAHN